MDLLAATISAANSNTKIWNELLSTTSTYERLLSSDLLSGRAEAAIRKREIRMRREYRLNNITVFGYLTAGNRRMARVIEQRGIESYTLNEESLQRARIAVGILINDSIAAHIDAAEEERRISGLAHENTV